MTATKTPPQSESPPNGGSAEPEAAKADVEVPEALDLTQGLTRTLIKVPTKRAPEGETFTLRLLDDFGIIDQQRLLSLSRRFESLWNKDEPLSNEEGIILEHALNAMFDEILLAPKAVKRDLPDAIKGRVVTSFSLAPLLLRRQRENQALESQSTTES